MKRCTLFSAILFSALAGRLSAQACTDIIGNIVVDSRALNFDARKG
ncbi:MAG TPA: hypothetical protein VLR94_00065 [Acidobacteriota bacterium]|nr:hypothetical protein [Acidobacteriota bacterium]